MSDVDVLLVDHEHTDVRAVDVLRRGLRRTPSIRRPLRATVGLSLGSAAARLAMPIVVQQVLDRGLLGDDGYRPGFVLATTLVALVIVLAVAIVAPLAEITMVRGAQEALFDLRKQAFRHIHRLSMSDHNRVPKGVLLARVTSDVEALSRFVEWGAVTWVVNVAVIGGAIGLMVFYSWQLTLIALAVMLAVVPTIRWLQVRQLRAYRRVRTAAGQLLSTFNEVLSGSDSIRSYGYEAEAHQRVEAAIEDRYRADLGTSAYTATLYTVGEAIGSVAMVTVALCAAEWGVDWGLTVGSTVSFFLLLALIQQPIGELTEVIDQTQTAVAGWDKVLTLLEQEPELSEPAEPVALPTGALAIDVVGVEAAYDDTVVLHDVSVSIPAGARVAVVGETGSGKTTFARLLCRLIEPVQGDVVLGGVPLSATGPAERSRAIRLVPQDGFLFDATVGANIAMGRPGAGPDDVDRAVADLGLDEWVSGLSHGLDTPVGPRGEYLSVGERQLVALARAQMADPGLLVLDEATSSVDPETEMTLSRALVRLAEGRTLVSIAHRLSTAEQADLVLVFDAGVLVQRGTHAELAADEFGVYAGLWASWQRATTAT